MGRGGSPTLSIALISERSLIYKILEIFIYSRKHFQQNSSYTDKSLDVSYRTHRQILKPGDKKSSRAISTARLSMLPYLHLQPINVVVYNDPQGKSNLVVGFALRCFQRLSRPDADTQRCSWRNNWYTGGQSITVLSY